VTEHECKTVSTIHAVSSGNDMKECVGNVGHEFVGQTEHIQSTTKFLAQQRATFRAGAPVKMGYSSKLGAFDWRF
jgi:hypothetical protein